MEGRDNAHCLDYPLAHFYRLSEGTRLLAGALVMLPLLTLMVCLPSRPWVMCRQLLEDARSD